MLAVIQDDAEALALFREAMKGEAGRPSTEESHNNVMELKAVQGNSRAYTVSRLKRDRPDLFERVVAGELSANRAAIEAGFRKVPTTLEQIKTMWSKATPPSSRSKWSPALRSAEKQWSRKPENRQRTGWPFLLLAVCRAVEKATQTRCVVGAIWFILYLKAFLGGYVVWLLV